MKSLEQFGHSFMGSSDTNAVFQRRSNAIEMGYWCLDSRVSAVARFLYNESLRRVYIRRENGSTHIVSSNNRRWTRTLDGNEILLGVRPDLEPSKNSVGKCTRSVSQLVDGAVFHRFSVRCLHASFSICTYERNVFQWSVFQNGFLSPGMMDAPKRPLVICPRTVLTMIRSYPDARYCMLKGMMSDLHPGKRLSCLSDDERGAIVSKISESFCSDFIGGLIDRMTDESRKRIPKFNKSFSTSSYLTEIGSIIERDLQPYSGIDVDTDFILKLKIPPTCKQWIRTILEKPDSGEISGREDEFHRPSKLRVDEAHHPSKLRVNEAHHPSKLRVDEGGSAGDNVLKGNELVVQSCAPIDTLRVDIDTIQKDISTQNREKTDEKESCMIDEEPCIMLAMNESTQDTEVDVQVASCSSVNAEHDIQRLSREFSPGSIPGRKTTTICTSMKKEIIDPEQLQWSDVSKSLSGCRTGRDRSPIDSPKSAYVAFKRKAESKFPNCSFAKFEKEAAEISAAGALLDLLQSKGCRNQETFRSWTAWYLSKLKKEDVDRYGIRIKNMLKTWESFKRFRPSTGNVMARKKESGDPIGDAVRLMVGDKASVSVASVVRGCRIFGVVIVGNYLVPMFGRETAERVIQEAIKESRDQGQPSSETFLCICAATRKYFVGRASKAAAFLSDWQEKFPELASSQLSDGDQGKADKSAIEAFFNGVKPS